MEAEAESSKPPLITITDSWQVVGRLPSVREIREMIRTKAL